MKKQNYEIVAWMTELDAGITLEKIMKMFKILPQYVDVIPFSATANNSSAFGFITMESFAEIDYDMSYIEEYIETILEDWDNETDDNTYTLPNGMRMYMGCNCQTILL